MFRVLIVASVLFSFNMSLYSELQFIDNSDPYTNEVIEPIMLPTENITEKYFVNTNEVNSFLFFNNDDIFKQHGVSLSDVNLEEDYKTSAIRHTEVVFFISAVFSYTYASLSALGLSALENSFLTASPPRSPYKTLTTSTATFEIVVALVCGAAVAYDSYMRFYGKKKSALSVSLVPYYDARNEDMGVVFSLSYPYRF